MAGNWLAGKNVRSRPETNKELTDIYKVKTRAEIIAEPLAQQTCGKRTIGNTDPERFHIGD
jgi:radical SAM superfamily enzyme with C-terminal helix-hairpin-helix motif